jgi:hypothetical protein
MKTSETCPVAGLRAATGVFISIMREKAFYFCLVLRLQFLVEPLSSQVI